MGRVKYKVSHRSDEYERKLKGIEKALKQKYRLSEEYIQELLGNYAYMYDRAEYDTEYFHSKSAEYWADFIMSKL